MVADDMIQETPQFDGGLEGQDGPMECIGN